MSFIFGCNYFDYFSFHLLNAWNASSQDKVSEKAAADVGVVDLQG